MKFVRRFSMLAILGFLVSLPAFAVEKNHGGMTLDRPAAVGGTELQPGDYKIQWDGAGPDVQVRIMQGRKTLATANAKLVEHAKSARQSDVVLKQMAGTTMAIEEVEFRNRREGIVFTSASDSN